MKLAGVLIGVLLAAVVAAGCGGDDGGETSSVTKAVFVKQAGAICQKTDADQTAAAFDLFKEQRERGQPSAQELQERTEEVVTAVIVPRVEQMAEELEQLEAPAGDSEEIAALIEAYETAAKEAKSEAAAFVDGKVDPFQEPREMAVAYGLKRCEQV